MNKIILVCGAGGFIGSNLVTKLKKQGHYVVGVDLKYPEFSKSCADEFYLADLRNQTVYDFIIPQYNYDEIYQLAADMGGAGYIFTGNNDYNVMSNSASINLNMIYFILQHCHKAKVFYSSSACIYPSHNQVDPNNPNCSENSAYPANPDSEYGWEKLFSERLYQSANRNNNLDIRIARFHNIFGPEGTYKGRKEKAPAALCRKVIESTDTIEVWGPGTQTRSFLYIDECLEGVERLMESKFIGPVNIGSDEMISINDLAKMVIRISGKNIKINNIPGPIGVNGRNSDNKLIQEKLNWKPSQKLEIGIEKTYNWIKEQIK